MVENSVDPIPFLQAFQNHSDQFRTQTGTALNYYQHCELLLSDTIIHNKHLKRYANIASKSLRSIYEIEQFPNYRDEASFYIDSSVDMVQKYTSQKLSSSK